MACFSLTSQQRIFLAACISVGLEGADTDEGMEEAIGAIVEELEASDKPIELTIMVDEAAPVGDLGMSDEEEEAAMVDFLDQAAR